MSESQVKRQILRQAVAENLATRRGEPLPKRPAVKVKRQQRSSWRPALAIALAATAGLALYSQRSTRSLQAEPSPAPIGTLDTEVSPASADLRYSAPQPIRSDVFPLEVRRIVIDPGHGGEDHGTSGHGLIEKEVTLDISKRLTSLLRADGYEVWLTREDDRKMDLRSRTEFANQLKSDLFVSVHVNWMNQRRIRGIETYYLGATNDPELERIVRLENRESGYSLSDMKMLLEGIYTGVRRDASQQFAARVQRSLYGSLRRVNPELKNRGVKTAPFVVLVSTEMPAILAEVSCLSNREEAQLLARPLYRDHIAEALFRGIRGYADDVHQTEEKGS